jgi:hypothetical protein
MTTNEKKTESNATPAGTAGSAATKSEGTSAGKGAAKRKQHQQQAKKANPEKKKQPSNVKSTFEGAASGVNPMKGIVIAQGNGNLAGQFRVYQKIMAGSAADDKAYGLDSAILDLTAKVKSDFVMPKPDPLVHSKLFSVMEKDDQGVATKIPTGEMKLLCFNPILKDEMDSEYNMDLKIQKSNWNQYERHYEGYYRTAIGNVEDTILTYCRADKRMAKVESNKDLVGFLLILRSVCAQNNGAVKVDEEYQNLGTLHSACGFKQAGGVSNAKFADQVIDRYGSAIFTCGKLAFGRSVYDKVLSDYGSGNTTLIDYLQLPADKQKPIDDLVKERTVARLIVKNSLNKTLKQHLINSYSTSNDECYPNTINDAISLLSTFANQAKDNNNRDDAVVSYHEAASDTDHDDDSSYSDEPIEVEEINSETDDNTVDNIGSNEADTRRVAFDATVMASIIAEATEDADKDQFLGSSFAQLQDVDDAYEDNEPDIVCCAHVIDDAINEHNNEDDPHGDNGCNNPDESFDMILYHTSQRINNKGDVRIVHYERGRADLITHEYSSPCAESIIDYADAMRLKLKLAGIHDSTDLMTIFEDRTEAQASNVFKIQLNDVNQKGIKTSTVRILKEETIRHISHSIHNAIRYTQMTVEIGVDDEMEVFPTAQVLLHHVVSAVAINQHRHKPNRWVNKVTRKLIDCGITNINQLEVKLELDALNDLFHQHDVPRLHNVTIHGFKLIMGMADFRQGRS